MKTLNGAAAAEAAKKLGTEPYTIIEVDWPPVTYYTDADHATWPVQGKLLAVSGLDSVLKLRGGSAGSLNFTLDDTDGEIKALLDTTDVHKRTVRVYQSFKSLAFNDKFLVFTGKLSTPIEWNEENYTLSFSAETYLDGDEIGFSPEETDYPYISPDAVGKPWPLCFGSPIRVPAVKLTEEIQGKCLTRYGLVSLGNLDQLASLATSFAEAKYRKEQVADRNPLTTDEAYTGAIEDYSSAFASLNEFLESLIDDSPTQESDLLAYRDIAINLAYSRINYEVALADNEEAKAEILPAQEAYDAIIIQMQNIPIELASNLKAQKDIIELAQNTIFKNIGNRAIQVEQQAIIDAAYAQMQTYKTDAVDSLADFEVERDDAADELSTAQAKLSSSLAILLEEEANIDTYEASLIDYNKRMSKIVLDEIVIENGDKFPQNTYTKILINGVKFGGTFSGEVFTLVDKFLPTDENIELATRQSDNINEFWITDSSITLKNRYCDLGDAIVYVVNQIGTRCFFEPVLWEYDLQRSYDYDRENYSPRLLGAETRIRQTSAMLPADWFYRLHFDDSPDYVTGRLNLTKEDYKIEIGDEVYLDGYYEDVYIANLIPSTQVMEVIGKRRIDGKQRSVPVPSDYYTVNLNESIAGQNATTIRFKRPLMQYVSEDWDKDIYVTLESTVGPNTASIIEYLVQNYTDLTPDATTFASVQTSLTNYPSHFALLKREDSLRTIENIAWQARCAVWVSNSSVYIKYLSIEDSSVKALSETEILANSLVVSYTPTEDLVTKFVANWSKDYMDAPEGQVVLRNNIPKYGELEESYDFYIYNIEEMVIKSATFWLIRYSNTWKIVNLKVFFNSIEIETFDTIELDFSYVATSTVKAVVMAAVLDTDDQSLTIEAHTPVRAGEQDVYSLFWPGSAPLDTEYPTTLDQYAGGAA